MGNQRVRGLKRVFRAARYSWRGVGAAFRHEEAFRQEVFLAGGLVPLGLWLGGDGVEKALLVGAVVLVLIVELLNTAVEFAVDRIGDEIHEYARIAKDTASAAVGLALFNVPLVWGLVLFF